MIEVEHISLGRGRKSKPETSRISKFNRSNN
jgi:hypothetical protein